MKLTIHQIDLPLEYTFTIAHESRDVQPTMIIRLEHNGEYGLGEAVATSYYGYTITEMIQAVEKQRDKIEQVNDFSTPESFYSSLENWFPNHSFLRCAFDIAAHDLYGKLQKQPLYRLWGYELHDLPASNYTIGIDSIERMKEKVIAKPWPLYKVKLGTEHDVQIIKELRTVTDAVFRVDANCAWTPEETIKNARLLKPLGVEFIEQPMPADELQKMSEVKQQSVLPLIADENCMVFEDVEACAGYFHGINIKLSKCGGLTPARKMIAKANELGLKKMVGCMTESSVGISAIGHLLPELDYVDMDGAILLASDPADGVWLDKNGQAHFPEDRNGTGARMKIK